MTPITITTAAAPAAEVSDRIDREQVAELASWAADTARLAPFNLGRRVRA